MLVAYLATVATCIKIIGAVVGTWCLWMSVCPWEVKGVNKRIQRIIGCIMLAIVVFTPTSNWIITYLGN